MKTINEIHTNHIEVKSEIAFLRQEINFFKKLLSKSYTSLSDNVKVKILDAYWKEFEKYDAELVQLHSLIDSKEHELAVLFQSDLVDMDPKNFTESEEMSVYYGILKGVRILKESFYSYMSENSSECNCH
jgi:uncharacterized coiled-coil DUF342 family protein